MKIYSPIYVSRFFALADQTIFAVANFTLTVTIARYHGESELAAFGIALSIALILQGIQLNNYIIHLNMLDRRVFRFRRRRILGEHLIATMPFIIGAAALSIICVSLVGPSMLTRVAVATMACFAIYCHVGFERVFFTKEDNYIAPFLSSAVYFLVNLYMLKSHASVSFNQAMLVLFAFGMVRYAVLMFAGRPDLRRGAALLRIDLRRNSLGSLLGMIGYSGYTHVPVFALGAFSTPGQVAAYVAFRSALQPSQIIMRSMDVVDKNQFREAIRASDKPRQVLLYQVLFYGGMSTAMSLAICFFSKDIVDILYHGKYYDYIGVLYIWATITVFFNMTQPIESAIVLKKMLTTFNVVRSAVGVLTAIVTVFIATPFGAFGVATTSMLAGLAVFSLGGVISLIALCGRPQHG
ncbi:MULTISPECIES: hypothetical protein [Rhodomicrobium]|uniref:hypothetical protein n=1 Tax=Rhodomicrobium TaxID=1068 RepID=UPI000B4AB81A|nr:MULTISPECIES: hypothetical protein [Rhodomicrobium]